MAIRWRSIVRNAAISTLLFCVVATSGRADTVIVTTTSVPGWFGLNEGPAGSVGEVAFLPGPEVPPAGVGSVTLRVDDEGRASFGTLAFKGTPLANITQLTFNSFSSSSLTLQWPSLQFDVDYDSTDSNTTYQGRLVFVPAGSVKADIWTAHDALAGSWWATRDPGQTLCPQSAPCSWAQVLAAFPNASVRNDPIQSGALLVRLGGPVIGGSTVAVDQLTVATGFPVMTFDFEPGATVNPSVGPPASVVSVEAYGFRPLRNVRVFFYTNTRANSRIKVCRDTSSLTGAFYCEFAVPPDPEAGPAGVHDVRVRGPRRIDYTSAFVLAP